MIKAILVKIRTSQTKQGDFITFAVQPEQDNFPRELFELPVGSALHAEFRQDDGNGNPEND